MQMTRNAFIASILTVMSIGFLQAQSGITKSSGASTGSVTHTGKLLLNSSNWDDHLSITRVGYGGTFKPDGSIGHTGLGLHLNKPTNALYEPNFYVLGGNVGIGTHKPGYQLDLLNAAGGDFIRLSRGNDSQGYGTARFLVDNLYDRFYLITGEGADASHGLMINENGNIGMGITSPQARLHVNEPGFAGTGGEFLRFTRGSGNARFMMDNDDNKLYMVTGLDSEKRGLVIDKEGKIGIGERFPSAQLHIGEPFGGIATRGELLKLTRGNGVARFVMDRDQDNLYIVTGSGSDASHGMMIHANGKVGIGTTSLDVDALLTVKGKANAREVKVHIDAGKDIVFQNNYNLMPLEQVEAFIQQNKHLPEVAPARVMEKEGLELGKFNMTLLQKVEELTLHTIAQQKEIKQLKKEKQRKEAKMEQMEKKMIQMMKRLEALEKQQK